ncbi:MAG: hypothetical protein ACLPUO_23310 [Streptosporangiaceae bacterium]
MALTIGAEVIVSDRTCAVARRCDGQCGCGRPGYFHLSGHHDRLLPRGDAITALLLAELEASGESDSCEAGFYRDILGLV